ncbi:type IV pilus assembly protein PilO [Povalibacter uvarum]|uniref:Type IV pilus assembly protein PilO n=1 Tax=Povalibacter uvarum TaxID=732238 RepID=A0A841HK74_9GAMM|nr:type 4a pilus biogenesis protein PilO [Povalibacter uvarum]MBB6092984.1 type IV pilus assembly protein PilO [Povalibacter uvarum]
MSNVLDDIRNLDPNDVGRWPATFRFGAIGVIFILAACLMVYFLVWKSKKPDLDRARAEEVTLTSTFEQKARKAANLDAYKAQLQEIERSFGAMLRKLPNKTEVPNLLTDISQQGAGAGLDQKLFQPGAQVNKDFYAELPIRMRLTGNFHSIGAFVSGIAALPRIVTLHNVTIAPVGRERGTDQLQLDVTAKTYRYLDDEEQAALKPAETASKKSSKKKKK